MNWSTVGWILGVAWVSLAAALAAPLVLAALLGEPWRPFGVAIAAALSLGGILLYGLRGAQRGLGHRDALLTVSLVWVSACAIGALPFATHPEVRLGPVDALFESVSGFTTTGATVLSGLDGLPSSVLLWRSITQWLGGMGIVIFGVAVLPLLGVGGMQLYKAEAPGPTKDKITPRIAETAKVLWVLYLGLTLAGAGVFFFNGMNAFDALNHAMTAVSTGGFSTHDQSLGYYDSGVIYFAATLTMLAGGTSFAVLHRFVTGGASWSDQPELRTYIGIFGLATAAIAADLLINASGDFPTTLEALQHASFQAASILTTTGYTTTDFDLWPAASHMVLLALFFTGGMAGSTAGGPKVVRVVLLGRVAMMQLSKLVHRHAVEVARLGRHTVDEKVVMGCLVFVSMWLVLVVAGTVALSVGGTDVMSSLCAAAVSLGNIGPGFGAVGPSHTFAAFDSWSKLVMSALMLLGRLEVYTLLVVLTPGFWRF
jgi:trk system potassium uptake protein TrkH